MARRKSVRELGEQYRRLSSRVGMEGQGRLSRAYLSTRRRMERLTNDVDKKVSTRRYMGLANG